MLDRRRTDHARRALVATAVAMAAGCRVDDIDLAGKQCPCVADWLCDETTNTCVRDPATVDAPGPDGPGGDGPPADARIDGPPSTSCLGDVFGGSLYASGLDDLTGWTAVGDGAWAAVGPEAIQSVALALNTYTYPTAAETLTDYRVALRGRRVAGTGVIAAAFRIQVGTNRRYRCTWRPSDGALKLEAPRPQGDYRAFSETQVAVGTIPGYDPAAPVTVEIEANATLIRCCVREIPGALTQGSDALFSVGPPGLETVSASGAFDDIQVNAP